MEETTKNFIALNGASVNAQKAFDAAFSEDFTDIPKGQKTSWAMAAIIHCDICRQVVTFNECKVDGLARLLFIADITSKLFEAHRWYFGAGSELLKGIARDKGLSEESIIDTLKKLASLHKIGKIQSYADYRNKFGYHYDQNALSYLKEFGDEDANDLHNLLMGFVKYSGDWAKITKSLIQDGKIPTNMLYRTS